MHGTVENAAPSRDADNRMRVSVPGIVNRIRAQIAALTIAENRRRTERELRAFPDIVQRDVIELDKP